MYKVTLKFGKFKVCGISRCATLAKDIAFKALIQISQTLRKDMYKVICTMVYQGGYNGIIGKVV